MSRFQEKAETEHWSQKKEVISTDLPIRFLIWLVNVFPFPLLALFVFPVGLFYTIFARQAYKESVRYQKQLIDFSKNTSAKTTLKTPCAYKQITSFALCLVEKVAAWSEKFSLNSVIFQDDDVVELKQQLSQGKGAMLITSHLGNMELLRSLATFGKTGVARNVPVIAIMDINVNSHFSKTLSRLNSRYQMDIISSSEIGMDSLERLQATLEKGGLVVVAGDRTPPGNSERTVTADFLGKEAKFPYGTFLLASLLDVPVYFVFSLRNKNMLFMPEYNMFVTKANVDFDCKHKERKDRINKMCQQFVGLMEKYCLEYPYQWYNFYDFWQIPEQEINK